MRPNTVFMDFIKWKSEIRSRMIENGSAPDFVENWLDRPEVKFWYEGSLAPCEVVEAIERRENADCI